MLRHGVQFIIKGQILHLVFTIRKIFTKDASKKTSDRLYAYTHIYIIQTVTGKQGNV